MSKFVKNSSGLFSALKNGLKSRVGIRINTLPVRARVRSSNIACALFQPGRCLATGLVFTIAGWAGSASGQVPFQMASGGVQYINVYLSHNFPKLVADRLQSLLSVPGIKPKVQDVDWVPEARAFFWLPNSRTFLDERLEPNQFRIAQQSQKPQQKNQSVPQEVQEIFTNEGFHILPLRVSHGLWIQVQSKIPLPQDLTRPTSYRGVAYGIYEVLQKFGFTFMHPLAPRAPEQLYTDLKESTQQPQWRVRGLHLHTQHPLEFTNFLNGWDLSSPVAKNLEVTPWEAQKVQWDLFLEWLLANKQNRVEWAILDSKFDPRFNNDPKRWERIRYVVERSHLWGIEVGADVPMVFEQQNSKRLLTMRSEPDNERSMIISNLKLFGDLGFDFLSTEMGTSEFTATDCSKMLSWLDLASEYMQKNGKEFYAKVHMSNHQTCPAATNTNLTGPINYNFLPSAGHPSLGIYAHTVQFYQLNDPAPVYGNSSFIPLHQFLNSQLGHRPVIWYPESSYWLGFDIDVPLFLPIYAAHRLQDLRTLGQEQLKTEKMDGQMVFSSGWEWGYWLNDVVAARSAWNPHLELKEDEAWLAITQSIFPGTPAEREALGKILWTLSDNQLNTLIFGSGDDFHSIKREFRRGIGYLSGVQTWTQIGAILHEYFGIGSNTQSMRRDLFRFPLTNHDSPPLDEIKSMLLKIQIDQNEADTKLQKLHSENGTLNGVIEEFSNALRMTVLRAKEMSYLYSAQYGDAYAREENLESADSVVLQASEIVKVAEQKYRIPAAQLTAWGPNPTSYHFAYLWPVHSLFYWRRDLEMVRAHWANPCRYNIEDPLEVGFANNSEQRLPRFLNYLKTNLHSHWGPLRNCIEPDLSSPPF